MSLSIERMHELHTMPYKDYLATEEWQARREYALAYAGSACQVCNSQDCIDVHHRTYERRGFELPSDLTVLCRECHELFSERIPGLQSLPLRDDSHVYFVICKNDDERKLYRMAGYANVHIARDAASPCLLKAYRWLRELDGRLVVIGGEESDQGSKYAELIANAIAGIIRRKERLDSITNEDAYKIQCMPYRPGAIERCVYQPGA